MILSSDFFIYKPNKEELKIANKVEALFAVNYGSKINQPYYFGALWHAIMDAIEDYRRGDQ